MYTRFEQHMIDCDGMEISMNLISDLSVQIY